MARTLRQGLFVAAWAVAVGVTSCLDPDPTQPKPDPDPDPSPTVRDPVVVVAVGDIVCGSGTPSHFACQHEGTAALARNIDPDAFLALGDIQYEKGSLEDFRRYYDPSWGTLKDKTYPAVGNHEYETRDAAGYFDYFNGVGRDDGRAGPRSKGYYSFQLGPWRALSLNSNCAEIGGCGPGSPQEQWLRAELAADTSTCTLAYWHHPRFASGGPSDTIVAPLWKALEEYNADLVLQGHVHTYERFAPMTSTGTIDEARGVRSFVVGTGGKNVYGFGSTHPGSEAKYGRAFGVLRLVLREGGFDWEFVAQPGTTFADSGSASCR